jgi:hypothetical protein
MPYRGTWPVHLNAMCSVFPYNAPGFIDLFCGWKYHKHNCSVCCCIYTLTYSHLFLISNSLCVYYQWDSSLFISVISKLKYTHNYVNMYACQQ